MQVVCQNCSKIFKKKNSECKKYPRHFCCRKCYLDTWSKEKAVERITLECSNCGISFQRRVKAERRPRKFCSRKCQYEYFRGVNGTYFLGGRFYNDHGYVLVLKPEHPRTVAHLYVYEHILVAEQKIGRYLRPNEVVHHLNGIKDDNRPENLEIMDNVQHTHLHHPRGVKRTNSHIKT